MDKKKTQQETPAEAKSSKKITDPAEEVKRLTERLIAKDKEYVAMEDELNERNGHLEFMVNALTRDKDRLTSEVADLKFENDNFTKQVAYLLEKVEGTRYGLADRIKILFTGKAK